MGHRQQMTDKQRLEWDIMQYKAQQEARKGHNHPYLTDELYLDLQKKGYTRAFFDNRDETHSESVAKDVRDTLRKTGHRAKIVCNSNDLRIKTYHVYYKKK